MRSLSVLVVSMLLFGGCSGGSTPTSPTPAASPIGTWAGSFNDPLAGEGAARVTFAELPPNTGGLVPTPQGAVGGTWSVTFRNGETASGQSYGAPVLGTSYTFFLYPDVAPCLSGQGPGTGLLQYSLPNAVVTSRTLTAGLVRGSCVDSRSGSITLTRQ